MRKATVSLRYKLMRVILPSMFLLTLFATLMIGHRRDEALRAETQRMRDDTTSLYADLAAEALWKLDRPALQALSERLLAISSIHRAEVQDEQGQSIVLATRAASEASAGANGSVITTVVRDVSYASSAKQSRRIGQIQIQFVGDAPVQALLPAFAWEFGLVMFTMLTMLGLSVALYGRLIRAPLDRLLQSIRASQTTQEFVQVPVSSNDEIGIIIDAYNSMQSHLAAHTLRLNQIYNQTPGLLFSMNAAGRLVSVSDFLCRSLGYARRELIGRELKSLAIHMESRASRSLDAALTQGLPIHGLQLQIQRGDGSALHALLNTFAQQGPNGQAGDSLCLMTDISKQVEDQAVISRQANFDLVTGLPNRYLLRDRLHMALNSAEGAQEQLALLFLDLDRFKAVNDTLGHKAGDDLLVEVARRLQEVLRPTDSVGRFGGDEFIIILHRVSARADVEATARRLLARLAEPFQLERQEAFVSASIGVAMFPEDGGDPEALLMNADAAMYRAKQAGRNTVSFFQSAMNDELRQRMSMERRLRDAVRESSFVLHLQPIVDLDSQGTLAFESLVRMSDGVGGRLIPPDRFISLAEDLGLIVEIGLWVLEESLRILDRWPVAQGGPQYIAVNVSAKQLARDDFVEQVHRAIARFGTDPARLVLEITESCVIDQASGHKDVFGQLSELKSIGCRLALDDFGTGYSSLSMLRQLPVDILKIDRSFIAGVPQQAADADLVRALLAIAESMNLKVVAEGIETDEQAQFLRDHGAGLMAQGYLFGRPASLRHWNAVLAPQTRAAQTAQSSEDPMDEVDDIESEPVIEAAPSAGSSIALQTG